MPTSRQDTTPQDLGEVEANVRVLIVEELTVQHELGAHPSPVPECPTCRAHAFRRDPAAGPQRAA